MCAARADGVPALFVPPTWRDFTASGAPACGTGGIDCSFDDPRWRGATALTYTSASGSANPPVQFRTVWQGSGASRALYLQWVIRIGVAGAIGNAHDLFVAFERPDTAALTAGQQRAYVVKLHLYLDPSAAVTPVGPTGGFIGNPSQCTTLPGTDCPADKDYFAVFQNFQGAGGVPVGAGEICSTISGDPYRFEYVSGAAGAPAWLAHSVQYERRCSGATAGTCDTWVVSMRVPLVDVAATRPNDILGAGIEHDAANVKVPGLWYQVDLGAYDPGTGFVDATIDSWPRHDAETVAGPTDPWCVGATPDLYFKDSDDDNGGGLGSGPKPWAKLYAWNNDTSGRPADCFGGIALTPDDVGNLVRGFGTAAPSATTVLGGTLDRAFKAYVSSSNRATNAVIARPRNNGAALTAVKLKARFRLAMWGVQPGTGATWNDVPGSSATGVCASGSGATCSGVDVAAGSKAVIQFDWSVGGATDPVDAAGALEMCQFGIAPPAATGFTCLDCAISPPTACDPVNAPASCGTEVESGGRPVTACTRKLWDHQCMLVELDSDSAANIENQSVYQNMDVRPMSEVAREATISVRGLAAIPGAKGEQVYLVVMPRNMPASTGGAVDGVQLVQRNAATARDRLLRPYRRATEGLDPERVKELIIAVRQLPPAPPGMGPEVITPPDNQDFPRADLPLAAGLMEPAQRAVAERLDGFSRFNASAQDFTESALATFDDITATTIVPTLDVYAFRRGPGRQLEPLTSFSLVVHHDGPLYGITWEIDNAQRINRNLFRVDMPVGHRTRVRVRAMAKESSNDQQLPGKQHWPCPGGCCGPRYCSEPDVALGNGLPIGVAGLIVLRGRRRRRSGGR
jgi:hypothetical protein